MTVKTAFQFATAKSFERDEQKKRPKNGQNEDPKRIVEYLGFDPSTSSLLRTHASDCANTPRPNGRGMGTPAAGRQNCTSWQRATCAPPSPSRLAQLVERKTLNLVVVGSSPTVGAFFVLQKITYSIVFIGKLEKETQFLLTFRVSITWFFCILGRSVCLSVNNFNMLTYTMLAKDTEIRQKSNKK